METAENAARTTAYVDGQLGLLALELASETEVQADQQPHDQAAELPDELVYIQYSHTGADAYPLTEMVRF